MSYATIFIPSSGILAAYPTGSPELASALGIYLCAWLIITVLFLCVYSIPLFHCASASASHTCVRSIPCLFRSVAFVAVLTTLATTFALLAGAQFSGMLS